MTTTLVGSAPTSDEGGAAGARELPGRATMRFHTFIGGLCGLSMLTGVGAVTVVAAPSGVELEVHDLDVEPDPSTVGETVTISNADEDGRCGAEVAVSEHGDSFFYVELTIEPPTGDPTTVHVATEVGEDWEVEYTSAEVGVHEVTGECVDQFGGGVVIQEWAAGPDLVAAPAGGEPRPVHAYAGEFTVEAEDETTTTTTTTTVATTTTTAVVPGPEAGADTQTPPAAPAQASPTFVG